MRQDDKAKLVVAREIHDRFHAMKTYGKEPESLTGIIGTMLSDLAEFPPENVLRAFKTHAQRSQEFPTTADLVGLIRRNGRPPLKESEVIAIRKKAGEDRTSDEWAMLREWEDQQSEGWGELPNPDKAEATLRENITLRQQVKTLTAENKRLADLLHQARVTKGLEPAVLTLTEKIAATVEAMRQGGASEDDIAAFEASQGVAA